MENRRNIALFFAAYFLEGLCFYGPVATLYRQAAGLTLLEIGTLESVSVAVMLLLELPWGWAADRLGHRRVIVVCTALYALSKVVFWRADGLWDFLLERLILAAALSGLSGCDSAYLYACGSRGDGQRRFGLWGAVQTAGLVTAGVCSTLFSATTTGPLLVGPWPPTLWPRCSPSFSPTRRGQRRPRRSVPPCVPRWAGASPTPRCWWERPFSARRCSLWVSFSTSSSISAPAFPPSGLACSISLRPWRP